MLEMGLSLTIYELWNFVEMEVVKVAQSPVLRTLAPFEVDT